MFIPRTETIVAAGTALPVPAVMLQGFSKSFGERCLLESVNLTVAPGSSVALIGANGTGKSTLLKCLIRLVEPTAGSIRFMGEDVTHLKGPRLRRFRSRVGMVWQKHNLVPRLSALTNVVHGVQSRTSGPTTWLHALAPQAVRQEAMDCLEKVGLADRALQRVDSLSGGQSQRVAIARMLMQKPEVILADEPDASLDPKSGEDIMALLSNLARQDRLTLIVVSHRIEHTLRFADRIIGLADRGIALDTPASQVDAASLTGFFDARSSH